MSDYEREKVLRISIDYIDLDYIKSKVDIDNLWNKENLYELVDKYLSNLDKFEIAPTRDFFIDYVLEHDYDNFGDYGKIRSLYESEKEKYLPIFKQLDPNIDMNNVKLVEFCWYNCSEAPSYYDEDTDAFYQEV